MAEPQTTTEYNPLGKLLGVLALLAAGLYFTGWTYRWTYFSFFQLEVTTLNLPGESFYLAAFQTFFGEPLAFLRTILVLGVTVLVFSSPCTGVKNGAVNTCEDCPLGTCALIMYLLGERSSPLHCGQNPLL